MTAGARKCTKRLQLMHPFVDISDVLPKKAVEVGSWRDGGWVGLVGLQASEESSVELEVKSGFSWNSDQIIWSSKHLSEQTAIEQLSTFETRMREFWAMWILPNKTHCFWRTYFFPNHHSLSRIFQDVAWWFVQVGILVVTSGEISRRIASPFKGHLATYLF